MRRAALAFAFMAVVLCGPSPARAKREPVVAVGKMLPDVTFDLGMGPVAMSALRGKPLVLNFWTTWCGPCIEELGVFSRMQAEFGDRVRLVTISPEKDGAARRYLADHRLALPLVEDPHNTIETSLELTIVPVTIVVRQDGMVSYLALGELNWDELRQAVSSLL
jgi:cytochrome c biogenesis protein CcmG/thiol:disulfide interchange protein DsbE